MEGTVTLFLMGHNHGNQLGLTAGPGGTLWYTADGVVGKFAPPSG
jgi:hypothetical protein